MIYKMETGISRGRFDLLNRALNVGAAVGSAREILYAWKSTDLSSCGAKS